MKKVVYPGTFDPVHLGHIDIVKRALKLFDTIVVAVAESRPKRPLFTLPERIELFKSSLREAGITEGVEIIGFNTLLVDLLKELKTQVVVRGIRLFTDFEYELQISFTNYKLAGVETLFMMPSQDFIHISSTIVKDIAAHGGSLKGFVTPSVERALKEKLFGNGG
jgi:pantetheine-phosphate adenylyltransferase